VKNRKCGIRETSIVLECSTVKVVAPCKTGSSCSVLWGRQISDIVNSCVSPVASGTPHELRIDKLTNQFAKSNLLTYGVEVVLEVEFQQNSSDREGILLNQGRKVANLSDRKCGIRETSIVLECGIRETSIVLECSTVKVVAPWKTGSSCSVLWGRQISDIVNSCVSPVASGTPHEL